MRKLIIYIVFLFPFFLVSQTNEEIGMILEINKIRKNPKSYIPVVESYIKRQEILLSLMGNSNLTVKTKSSTNILTTSNDKGELLKSKSGSELINDEILVAKQLITILENMNPMDTLVFNPEMYVLTKVHSDYLKSINKFGHFGPNGDNCFKRMESIGIVTENVTNTCKYSLVNLIVDYGVPGHGHRENILNPKAKQISISINEHCVVQNFML